MVRRSKWQRTLTMMAWAGMAFGQTPVAQADPSAPVPERTIKVVEMGKPAQKCRVLKSWTTPEGHKAYEVQALAGGEVMTIVESGPLSSPATGGGKVRALATRIFHWGQSSVPPRGSPIPPSGGDSGYGAMACSTGVCGASPCNGGTMIAGRLSPVPTEKGYEPMPAGDLPRASKMVESPRIVQSYPARTPIVKEEDVARPKANDEVYTQILPKPLYPPSPKKAIAQEAPKAAPPALISPKVTAAVIVAKPTEKNGEAAAPELLVPTPAESTVVERAPASRPQLLPAPLFPPKPAPVEESSVVVEATFPAETPIVVEEKQVGTIAVMPTPNGDFRESWGKPTELPAAPLPQAKSVRLDPLVNPENYGHNPGERVRPQAVATAPASAAATGGQGPAADAAQSTASVTEPQRIKKTWTLFGGLRSKPKESTATTMAAPQQAKSQPSTAQAARPFVPTGNETPLGAGSVYAAASGVPGPVRYVPVPIVTLPGATRPPAAKLPAPPPPRMPGSPQPNEPQGLWANAFSTPASAPQPYSAGQYAMGNGTMIGTRPNTIPGYPHYPNGQPYPNAQQVYAANPMAQPYARPTMQPGMYPPSPAMGQGLATGQGAQATSRGVVPASYNQATPALRATGLQCSPGVTAPQTAQMLAMLRDSLYPSQREWAAENLTASNMKAEPHVVEALTVAATKDPAATVRAGCVRALAKMNATSVPVVTAVQALKNDGDPRVRVAAEEALGTLIDSKGER